jgi:succinate dehydrogenase hydrophobic anchor subunit
VVGECFFPFRCLKNAQRRDVLSAISSCAVKAFFFIIIMLAVHHYFVGAVRVIEQASMFVMRRKKEKLQII